LGAFSFEVRLLSNGASDQRHFRRNGHVNENADLILDLKELSRLD